MQEAVPNQVNWHLWKDTVLEAQGRETWVIKTPGESVILEFYQVLPVSEKNPLVLPAGGRENEPLWNTPEHFVLLNTACPLEKLTEA